MHLGEAAVLSTKAHSVDPAAAGLVSVLLEADAGKVFYGRAREGEVYHLDIFHREGEVDHRRVAARIRQLVLARQPEKDRAETTLDRMDIQTGTGGGRVNGDLGYGQKSTLRQAHRNHVHLAFRLPPGGVDLVLALADAVEQEVLVQGSELCRVEKIAHRPGGGAPVDLSAYTDFSDSHLREDHAAEAGAELPDPRLVADLAEHAGGLERLQESLSRLADAGGLGDRPGLGPGRPDLRRRLEDKGLVVNRQGRLSLTPSGDRLKEQLQRRLREIEAAIRRLYRRSPASAGIRRHKVPGRRPPAQRGHVGRALVGPLGPGQWVTDLAVPETAVQLGWRRLMEGAPPQRGDLRVNRRRPWSPIDVCLLIDASASMAGRRMQAAKFLARHLLLSTRERVSVLAFHEDNVKVVVPFGRSYRRLEAGLTALVPTGLTPMAQGLVESCDYLRRARARRPLLLLITDGIPTVPRWGVNPIEDALRAAGMVAGERLRFACIGLEPSRAYLEGIARQGRGTLYILDDLEEGALVRVARSELAHAGNRG